ncbi:RNase3 domain-containing protein [Sodiomyces alkalinus F11]|uniref:Dicer-like protein 1 n=1 Tax=Sodiomyces alkalinus (strain CBS 110278 / VKM F-3762 / F11) TaxID=1314773 RepID=A0A3N2Q186_SODAK|nr:RNase3 domain-containing protein [Sodiomyces alkalinus F11]ROT40524.1 RNase3 domain-containing protein [Sodiomyces alkalinus F11]
MDVRKLSDKTTGSDDDNGSAGDGDSDSSDSQSFTINPPKAPKTSEKKRADYAAFQSWIHDNRVQRPNQPEPITPRGPKRQSASLLHQGRRIINNPREYQMEIFERAKKKNIIAVLPTGSGKTLIAAMLLRHCLEKEIADRHAGNPKRTAFFLVEKVALVNQQHAVLECNLDYPIARLCGAMLDPSWHQDDWQRQWDDHMVVVCTAAILQSCLAKSFIRIDQVNLLVFDEAHHAKGNHPYARIIKDFYVSERDLTRRPRIFGMTASPVDAQTDISTAAIRLEGLLHSEIATIPDDAFSYKDVQNDINDHVLMFDYLPEPFTTPLHLKIQNLVRRNRLFSGALTFSHASSAVLGPWCVDRFWQLLLTEEMISRLAAKTRLDFDLALFGQTESAAVDQLRQVIRGHSFSEVSRSKDHLSSKVIALLDLLQDRFRNPTSDKCIIFADQRNTAILLADLLRQSGVVVNNLQAAPLVGGQADAGPFSMSYPDQVDTILRFKRGHHNCLVATSVAEEGLDIPDCNLVVRFDRVTSVIQYVQSRGRARQQNSEYVCMIERGKWSHIKSRKQAAEDYLYIRRFCNSLPEDRKIQGWDPDATAVHLDRHREVHVIPSTGATLNWSSSLELVSNFVSSLQAHDEVLSPSYLVLQIGRQYICEVQLPSKSPVQAASGTPQKSKAEARCSAAFALCMELVQKKYVDHHLRPVFAKTLPAMRNARLAISSRKRAEYTMRTKPQIWSRLGPVSSSLFATFLTLESPEAVGRSTRPLVLLTRERLPDLPGIPLFFGNERASTARPVAVPGPLPVTADDLECVRVFTLRIFKDIFSKEYDAGVEDLPYFLVPSSVHHHDLSFSGATDPSSCIDWGHLRSTRDLEYLSWDETSPPSFFRDKFVIDPFRGNRKLYLRGVREDMKPTDQVPDGVPDPGYRMWKDVEHNIKEYSVSLWASRRKDRVWRDNQPVIEAEVVSMRRNFLGEFEEEEEPANTCYVILEPLHVSTVPADVAAMALLFPAIMHRIEDNLIALDACKMLKLEIRPDLALEAMTKDSDNSEDHDQEKINFQAGMGKNYERLEFLGDCFLKMATTIALFTQIPENNEFEYHVERMLLISNQNLLNVALKKNLQEFVRSQQFNRRSWYPEGLRLKRGKAARARAVHSLADKSIADVCEALIGASYLTYTEEEEKEEEEEDFDMAVRAVTAVVRNKNHKMSSYKDYYARFRVPDWQTAAGTPDQLRVVREIKEQMGYEFKSPALLRCAFKHPSYPRQYENVPNYQRLEFLGDALLDMVCVDFLFKKFPHADPQWLTEHKMAMVANEFLACLCVHLGFHHRILHLSPGMSSQIKEYVGDLHLVRREAEHNAASPDEVKPSYWIHVDQPGPKFLSDVVEAYIGALFVDSQYDFGQVRRFFEQHVRPFFTDMALYDSFASRHPVTTLTHKMREELGCRDWRLLVSEVPPAVDEAGAASMTDTTVVCGFMVHGRVCVHETAVSGRHAKIATAKTALKKLEETGWREAFRKAFGCDCDGMGGRGGDELPFQLTGQTG